MNEFSQPGSLGHVANAQKHDPVIDLAAEIGFLDHRGVTQGADAVRLLAGVVQVRERPQLETVGTIPA